MPRSFCSLMVQSKWQKIWFNVLFDYLAHCDLSINSPLVIKSYCTGHFSFIIWPEKGEAVRQSTHVLQQSMFWALWNASLLNKRFFKDFSKSDSGLWLVSHKHNYCCDKWSIFNHTTQPSYHRIPDRMRGTERSICLCK